MKLEARAAGLTLDIRPLTRADEPELRRVLELPEMMAFVTEEGAYASAQEFGDFYMSLVEHPDCANWGVFTQIDGKETLVAVRDVYPCPPTMKHDEIEETAKVTGSWVNPAFRRRGIAFEAGKAVIEHTFAADPGLVWLQVSCYEDNVLALKLIQKLGFHFLGAKPYNGKIDKCFVMHRDPAYDYARVAALRPTGQESVAVVDAPPAP